MHYDNQCYNVVLALMKYVPSGIKINAQYLISGFMRKEYWTI